MHSYIQNQHVRIGIDIGGTFTDFVVFNPDSGDIETFKLPSTPQDPSEAVLIGLRKMGLISSTIQKDSDPNDNDQNHSVSIIHGSTVATKGCKNCTANHPRIQRCPPDWPPKQA